MISTKDTNAFAKVMSGKYSDLKLVCQGTEFKVHKVIVCTQSSVIEAACDDGFQETATNTIVVKEFDPETVKLMVEYLYTKDYTVEDEDVPASEEGSDHEILKEDSQDDSTDGPADDPHGPSSVLGPANHTMLRHARVNAIADYYDIPELKKLANMKLQCVIDVYWSASDFANVANKIFQRNGDKEIRQMVGSVAAAHIEELAELDNFAELDVMSDLGVEIIRNMLAARKTRERLFNEELQAVRAQLQQADIDRQTVENEKVSIVTQYERFKSIIDRNDSNADSCHDILKNTKSCRNVGCNAEFNCYIEHGGTYEDMKFTLRCSKCKCKHKYYSTWTARQD